MIFSKLVKNATLKIYPGGSHSLGDTSKDELNADLSRSSDQSSAEIQAVQSA